MRGARNANVWSVDDHKEDYNRWRSDCKTLLIIDWNEKGGMLGCAAGWQGLRSSRRMATDVINERS